MKKDDRSSKVNDGAVLPVRQSRTTRASNKDASKHKSIKDLRCYKQVHDKLCAGVACEEVARWIQEDMLELLDTRRDTLTRSLYRYKADIPPKDLVHDEPLYIQKAIEKLKRGVNEVEELEKLYLLQIRRISMDAETESNIHKLFGGTMKEIELAANILDKMSQLKMDLGVHKRSPMGVAMSGGMEITQNYTEGLPLTDEQKLKFGAVAYKLFEALSAPQEIPKKE